MKLSRILGLMMCAVCAQGATYYVAQTAEGADDGSSCANAKSIAWHNAGTFAAGDTIRLCGTFTTALTVPSSGSAGNVITYVFETGAKFEKAVWASTGAINASSKSYITIDGGANTNGIIRNTANGSGLANTNNSVGIAITGGTDVTVKRVQVIDMYKKITGNIDETRYGYGIQFDSVTRAVIETNYVDQCDGGITYSGNATLQTNIYIRGNTLRHSNHTMTIGVANTNGEIRDMHIVGNDMDYWLTWDAPGDTQIHLDGIIVLNNSYDATSVIDGLKIYNNRFGGYVGTRTTAGIFNSMANPYIQSKNWWIYNNLFLCFTNYSWGNGFVNVISTNGICANNTMIGVVGATNFGGGITFGGGNAIVKNNILWSGSGITLRNGSSVNESDETSSGADTEFILTNYFSTIYSDRNIIGGSSPGFQIIYGTPGVGDTWLSGILGTLTQWQTWSSNNRGMTVPIWNTAHADPNSAQNYPTFESGTYIPDASDTYANEQGENLSVYFDEDLNGNSRPAVGAWDIGAFQSSSSPGGSIIIAPGIRIRSGVNLRATQ